MIEKPANGLYFIVRIKGGSGYMVGKIIDEGSGQDRYGVISNWKVKVLKTNIFNYKVGEDAVVFIHKNPVANVEYFEHEYEIIAKIL